MHRAASNAMAAGFVGGVQDSPPATIAQTTELLSSCIQSSFSTVPTEWVRVTKSEMAGPIPWYKTVQGTADSTEESPGQIVITGNGTDSFLIEYRGVFVFKTSLATANTPAALALRQRMREERQRAVQTAERTDLLRVLGSQPPSAKGA
jgi:hypothetical protein